MRDLRALSEEIDPRLIKTIQGEKYAADYIPWHVLAQLLIGRLRAPFEWRVTKLVPGDEWVVAGELTATVDGHPVTVGAVKTGADAEEAESRALCRAAAKLGLGLHLYCAEGEWFLHKGLERLVEEES